MCFGPTTPSQAPAHHPTKMSTTAPLLGAMHSRICKTGNKRMPDLLARARRSMAWRKLSRRTHPRKSIHSMTTYVICSETMRQATKAQSRASPPAPGRRRPQKMRQTSLKASEKATLSPRLLRRAPMRSLSIPQIHPLLLHTCAASFCCLVAVLCTVTVPLSKYRQIAASQEAPPSCGSYTRSTAQSWSRPIFHGLL